MKVNRHNIISSITEGYKDIDFVKKYTEMLKKNPKYIKFIPEHVIDDLIKDGDQYLLYSFMLAIKFDLSLLSESIRNKMIMAISDSSYFSWAYAEELEFDPTKIPKEIIDSALHVRIADNDAVNQENAKKLRGGKEILHREQSTKKCNCLLKNSDIKDISHIEDEELRKRLEKIYSNYDYLEKCIEMVKKNPRYLKFLPDYVVIEISNMFKPEVFKFVEAIGYDLNLVCPEARENIIKKISKSKYFSHQFCNAFNFNVNKIPKEIYEFADKSYGDQIKWQEDREDERYDEASNIVNRNIVYGSEIDMEDSEALYEKDRQEKKNNSTRFINKMIGLLQKSPRYLKFLPESEINNIISLDSYSAFKFIETLNYDFSLLSDSVKNKVLEMIGESFAFSYRFCEGVEFDKSRIPDRIMDSAKIYIEWTNRIHTKDPDRARRLNIPKIPLETLGCNSKRYNFKKGTNIYGGGQSWKDILKQEEEKTRIFNLREKNRPFVDKIIHTLYKNPGYIKTIPDFLINEISKDGDFSFGFVRALKSDFTKVPKEIFYGAFYGDNYGYSRAYYLAKELNFDMSKIPKEIVELANKWQENIPWKNTANSKHNLYKTAISKEDKEENEDAFIRKVLLLLKKNPRYIKFIPDYMIYRISQDSEYSYLFAAYIFKSGSQQDIDKIPKEIMESIIKSPGFSLYFAEYLNFDLSKIPKEIIKSISSEIEWSYYLSEGLRFDLSKVPKEIIDSANKYKGNIPWKNTANSKHNLSKTAISKEDKENQEDTFVKKIFNVLRQKPKYLRFLPESVINDIMNRSTLNPYLLAQAVKFDLSGFSEEARTNIISQISNHSDFSYHFAKGVGFDLTQIPQEMIESISKNNGRSYQFAKDLQFDLTKIPHEIIRGISTDSELSYRFAHGLKFNMNKIPQEIIDSAGRYEYKDIRWNDFVRNKKSNSKHNLSKTAIDKEERAAQEEIFINKVLETLEKNPKYLRFIPDSVINQISKTPDSSYIFAKILKFDLSKIPKEIIESISRSSDYAYFWAKTLQFDLSKISKEIIESISKTPKYSYAFAKGLQFGLIKIPKEIIDGICKDSQFAYHFAYHFIRKLEVDVNKIPKEIIESISDNSGYSYYLAQNLQFDINKIPKEIIDSANKWIDNVPWKNTSNSKHNLSKTATENNILQVFSDFYEYEWKYSLVKNAIKEGRITANSEIYSRIYNKLDNVCDQIIEYMASIFDEWIRIHFDEFDKSKNKEELRELVLHERNSAKFLDYLEKNMAFVEDKGAKSYIKILDDIDRVLNSMFGASTIEAKIMAINDAKNVQHHSTIPIISDYGSNLQIRKKFTELSTLSNQYRKKWTNEIEKEIKGTKKATFNFNNYKYAQIWNVDTGEGIESNIKAFYELEYKYSMIRNKPFNGNPERQANIVKGLEGKLSTVFDYVKGVLSGVFGKWLEFHALFSAETWAKKRVEDLMETDEDITIAYENMLGEYIKYNINSGENIYDRKPNTNSYFLKMINEAIKNLKNMPELSKLCNASLIDYKDMLKDDLESGGLEAFNSIWGKSFKTEEEAEKFIDRLTVIDTDIESIFVHFEDLASFVLEANNIGNAEAILVELYKKFVFPYWLKFWKDQGIAETRKNIVNIYKKLQAISMNDPKNALAVISLAINALHQTGNMLDYIVNSAEGSGDTRELKEFLDEMSAGKKVEEWNLELREIGVQI